MGIFETIEKAIFGKKDNGEKVILEKRISHTAYPKNGYENFTTQERNDLLAEMAIENKLTFSKKYVIIVINI